MDADTMPRLCSSRHRKHDPRSSAMQRLGIVESFATRESLARDSWDASAGANWVALGMHVEDSKGNWTEEE